MRRPSARAAYRIVPWAAALCIVYGLLSFGWSTIGFAVPLGPVHLHEYSLNGFVLEAGGHVLFGLLVALPTLDPGLILLCGGEAILIDSDHFLAALNFPVESRLAHSIGFMLLAPLVMAVIARRGRGFDWSVGMITFASLFAHLSYDVYAGNGMVPVLAPFTLNSLVLPAWSWAPLEATGMSIAILIGLLRLRRMRLNAASQVGPDGG